MSFATYETLWDRQLLLTHWHELESSGIDQELAQFNFASLVDSESYGYRKRA